MYVYSVLGEYFASGTLHEYTTTGKITADDIFELKVKYFNLMRLVSSVFTLGEQYARP